MSGSSVDTHGVLDRCSECHARARFIHVKGKKENWWVECSECANRTDSVAFKGDAMVQWNKEQRRNK